MTFFLGGFQLIPCSNFPSVSQKKILLDHKIIIIAITITGQQSQIGLSITHHYSRGNHNINKFRASRCNDVISCVKTCKNNLPTRYNKYRCYLQYSREPFRVELAKTRGHFNRYNKNTRLRTGICTKLPLLTFG